MTSDPGDRHSALTTAQRELLDRWLQGEFPSEPEQGPIQPTAEPAEALSSFAQERLWFLERLYPGAPIYNEPLAIRLQGALDAAALEQALDAIARRHEVLRTTFRMRDGQLIQAVAPPSPVPLPVTDLAHLPPDERLSAGVHLLVEESRRPFDLAAGPVLRARLLRLGPADHVLFLVIHHIACDGWSLSALVREFTALYAAFCRGERARLPELPLRYADFAKWQRQWMKGDLSRDALSYWKAQLDGLEPLELPTDRPRPPVQGYSGRTHSFTLPTRLSEGVISLSRQRGATLFMTLVAAFQALLHRYSGQDDIAVGTPVAGRGRTELEPLVGLFVNMLVLRTSLSGDPPFGRLLDRVRDMTLAAYAHQDLPFEKLVEELQPKRELNRQPLFQVMFGLHNVQPATFNIPGLTASVLEIDRGASKFDLSLYMVETGQGLRGMLEYSTDLFDAGTIAQMARHYEVLLESVVAAPDRPVGLLRMLSPEERSRALVAWNQPVAPSWDGSCIHEIVEAQVERGPDRLALASGGERLTYRELNRRANLWARRLRDLGVGPEVPVGICIERCPDMIVAALAVLKAGGAYVPLDPTYPRARLSMMLRDTRVPVLLTQRHWRDELPETTARVLCVDERIGERPEGEAENLDRAAGADNLVYIIFTSGSSGTSKGVMITHRGLCSIIEAQLTAFEIRPESRVLQCASFCFDASASEIFTALAAGATLWLGPPDPVLAGSALQRILREAEISVVTLSPSVLTTLEGASLPALRTLVAAGEPCPAALVKTWAPGRRFVNAYGPTEASIGGTYGVCAPSPRPPAIGRPFPHATVYLLDRHLEPVPIGVPGEIYLGGAGVGRGYLNQPALTAERFTPDPFGGELGARFYRTGDLGRFLPDGAIEYLGRIDGQTKIRGVRVEVGEVEAALRQHPAVHQALVVTREDVPGDRRLIAYVVPSAAGRDQAPSAQELRDHTVEALPRYLIPSAFVLLDALPLTPNGKLDLRALPPPDRLPRDRPEHLVGPRDALELQLVQIWEDLLGVRPIGIHDDFFALGGHSLLSVRLLARIHQQFDRELPVSELFHAPTIEHVARLLRHQAPAPPSSPLVGIQPNGAKTPFFCVHPVGGNVLCYIEIARLLGADRPFYGLRSPGLHGERKPCATIEEMAALYLEAVRERQPEGPYLLGGWSMGGCVAFEMARQLAARGEEVALLALMDSHAITAVDLSKGIDDITLLTLLMLDLARQTGAALPPWEDDLERVDPAKRSAFALEMARSAGLLPADIDLAYLERLIEVFRFNLLAQCRYEPKPYPGHVTLFCGSDPRGWSTGSPDLGWGPLAEGGLTLDVIPGGHYALLREQAETLAGRLRARLETADTRASAPARGAIA